MSPNAFVFQVEDQESEGSEAPTHETHVSAPSIENQPGKPEHFEEVRIENPVSKPCVPVRHVGRAKRGLFTSPSCLSERNPLQQVGTFAAYEPVRDPPPPTPHSPDDSDIDVQTPWK